MATALPFKVVPFENKAGGTMAYRVTGSWRGKRTRENYADAGTAQAVCNAKNRDALADAEHTTTARTTLTRLSEEEIKAAEAGVVRAEGRWTLRQVITAGIDALEAAAKKGKGEPVDRLLESWLPLVESEVGVRWYRDLCEKCRAFSRAHPKLMTADMDRALVRTYLDSLDLAPQTKANHRNAIHRFCKWLFESGKIDENVASDIWISRKTDRAEGEGRNVLPPVFSPTQAEAFMRACETAECRRLKGWATLCTLAGLRPENEAPRLLWSEIDLEAATLRVLGTKRGQKPRVISLQPNAVAWLRSVKLDGEATPGFYARHLRLRATLIANDWLAKHHPTEPLISWREDIQRHSYASYRLGQGVDIKTVSEEMGNSPEVIYGHYRNPREPLQVKVFWAIMPAQ